MLALQPAKSSKNLTPNLLPCAIKHSGPVTTSKRYWDPSTSSSDNAQTAYFRGRKLRGRIVKLPKKYAGVVLQKTDKVLASKPKHGHEDDEEDEEQPVEVNMVEQKGTFDEMVVWGHEMLPEEGNAYIKSVEEWMSFAEAVHSYDAASDALKS